MLQIQSILHPTDFSECAQAALVYALDFAKRHEAELHLLHAVNVRARGAFDIKVDRQTMLNRLETRAGEHMERLLETVQDAGVHVRTAYLDAITPDMAVVNYAREQGIDLIVLGTHGLQRRFRKLFLGSVTQEVLKEATCPVMTVYDSAHLQATPAIQRVLAPIDFSEHSLAALAYAKAFAARHQAPLDLLHIIDPILSEEIKYTLLGSAEDVAPDFDVARRQLAELDAEVQGYPEVEVAYHVARGHPGITITEFADAHADNLIVMATHGTRGFQLFPLGSVSERVIRSASCPVFITRPFGKTLLTGRTPSA